MTHALPLYSEIRNIPSRRFPTELSNLEMGDEFGIQRAQIEKWLGEPQRVPKIDDPLFTELITLDEDGFLTITVPNSEDRILPLFSTPYRAADYMRTLLPEDSSYKYVNSTASQIVGLLGNLIKSGTTHATIDRCPRCDIYTCFDCPSITTADNVIKLWSICKATEIARMILYLRYARDLAQDGQLKVARDIMLETVGHVSMENPEPHFLLGQIAIAMEDPVLLHEAKKYLHYFKHLTWERKLDEIVKTGYPEFSCTGP